jgi:signal transduction histidine kinase
VSVSAEDGGAVVVIRDNGVGFSEEDRRRAFDRFYKGHPTVRGSGVGLSISRKIVEDLGGSIDIASEGPGRGAAVTIRLPGESPVSAGG